MPTDKAAVIKVRYSDNGGFNTTKLLLHITKKNRILCGSLLAGVEGFEPSKWRSQSPMPYHLATPQYSVLLPLP